MRNRLIFTLLTLACSSTLLFAQLPDETSGRVPELDAFHKPIYTLWHDAWPAKDIAKLKSLLPDIERAYATLASAKLPGILRDKKKAWDEKLRLLDQAMKEYRASVAQDDRDAILKAAENVHSAYEQMVRVVRPVMRELDAFHQVLYMLHHYYLPERDTAQIEASAESLVVRMGELNAAALPKRLEMKSDQFVRARKSLDEAVRAFSVVVKAKRGMEEIAKIENRVHERYQDLERVFE